MVVASRVGALSRKLFCVLATVALLSAVIIGMGVSKAYAGSSGYVYVGPLYNGNSGLCLDVYHSGTSNGTNVDQNNCNGSNAQKWAIFETGSSLSGYPVVQIQSYVSSTNFVLETYHSLTSDGANVDIWTSNGTDTQFWIDFGGTFVNLNSWNTPSAQAEAFEVYHSSLVSGANVDQWHVNGTNTQNWNE